MFRSTIFVLAAAVASACNTTTNVFVPIDGRTPEVEPPVHLMLDRSCENAMTGPYEDALPVPVVQVEEDDGSAHLRWLMGDGAPLLDSVAPPEYEGARVCWGASMAELTHATLFTGRRGQLFGLMNGQPYVAVVQSVDAHGRLSRPSAVVSFTGSSARVDALRQQMTGFFDDFNISAGALDGRLWNIAYSVNDPTASGTFVSEHQHAVSMLSVDSQIPGGRVTANRTQNVARPRAVFDFTGREGRIVFDMDGTEGGRHTWYLDIFPYASQADVLDITAHPTFDPGPGYPGRFLRIAQSGGSVFINQHAANGDPTHALRGELPRDLGTSQFMRHFEIRVSRTRAAIYIDGQLIFENPDLDLDFERAFVHWSQFGYNLIKMDRPWSTIMWDNFGFDGPAPSVRIHNYQVGFNGGDYLNLGWVHNPPDYVQTGTLTIPIPDSVAGATGARLFYTLDDAGRSPPLATDTLTVNGQQFTLPMPPTEFKPYSNSIAIPTSLLVQGDNQIVARMDSAVLANVHIEVELPAALDAPYTQPEVALGRSCLQTLPAVGPDAYIQAIDGVRNGVWAYYPPEVVESIETADAPRQARWLAKVHGTIPVNVSANLLRAMAAYRQNLGIERIELLVDGVAFAAANTNASVPTPEIGAGPATPTQPFESAVTLMVDTTLLTNGEHEFEARAYDSAGTYGRLLSVYTTPILHVTVDN